MMNFKGFVSLKLKPLEIFRVPRGEIWIVTLGNNPAASNFFIRDRYYEFMVGHVDRFDILVSGLVYGNNGEEELFVSGSKITTSNRSVGMTFRKGETFEIQSGTTFIGTCEGMYSGKVEMLSGYRGKIAGPMTLKANDDKCFIGGVIVEERSIKNV